MNIKCTSARYRFWRKALAATLFGAVVLGAPLAAFCQSGEKSQVEVPVWPLPDRTDFSSGYGDFRPGRFHYGLDLRTGDRRLPVVAPVSGFVSQIWLSYFGYGKALYLKADDGSTYVFAHLDRFAPAIDSVAKTEQFASERYFQRKWFKPEEFPVGQGDTIAFSGKTGIGAPHLHFESRDNENVPRSPLRRGFKINDNKGPEFFALSFEYLDQKSVFSNVRRRLNVGAEYTGNDANSGRHFSLDYAPYFSAEFGVIAHVRDYPTNKKFSASPHRLHLSFTGPLAYDTLGSADETQTYDVYDLTMDSLSYTEGALSFCIYEQGLGANGDKNAYLLFQRGEVPDCFDARGGGMAGRFPVPVRDSLSAALPFGVYKGRVDAYDASGAGSFLNFRFCYGPPGDLFFVTDYSTEGIFLSAQRPELFKGFMQFTKLEVGEVGSDGSWREYPGAQVKRVADGIYKITFAENRKPGRESLLRLRLSGIDGWSKLDTYLSSRRPGKGFAFELSYSVGDGGLYVDVKANQIVTEAPHLRAELANGSQMNLSAQQVGPKLFRAFVPVDSMRAPIVAIEVYASGRANEPHAQIDGLFVAALIGSQGERYFRRAMPDGTVFLPRDGLKTPRMIELLDRRRSNELIAQKTSILAGPYELGPNDFRYDEDVRLGISPGSYQEPGLNVALCKLNKKEDGWDWFDTEYEPGAQVGDNGVFWAEINSPGVYALLRDNAGPKISGIKVGGGNPGRTITLKLADGLSAIWSDTLIDARVDGQWLIPEYDAEDEVLKLEAKTAFAPGAHELVLTVTDNAGNRVQRKHKFTVKR